MGDFEVGFLVVGLAEVGFLLVGLSVVGEKVCPLVVGETVAGDLDVGDRVGSVGLRVVGFLVVGRTSRRNTRGHHQGQPKSASPRGSGSPKGTVGLTVSASLGTFVIVPLTGFGTDGLRVVGDLLGLWVVGVRVLRAVGDLDGLRVVGDLVGFALVGLRVVGDLVGVFFAASNLLE